jgi:hypothetical protein
MLEQFNRTVGPAFRPDTFSNPGALRAWFAGLVYPPESLKVAYNNNVRAMLPEDRQEIGLMVVMAAGDVWDDRLTKSLCKVPHRQRRPTPRVGQFSAPRLAAKPQTRILVFVFPHARTPTRVPHGVLEPGSRCLFVVDNGAARRRRAAGWGP